jgi:DTW domain-containing protein
MHPDLCVCDLVPVLPTATRLIVVMHRREWTKTTATAHLLAMALPSGELRVRGHRDAPLEPEGLVDPERRTLLLFPSDDSVELSPALMAADPRPVTLVVPDGSWRQASKMPRREPLLRDLPRVRLPDGQVTRYRLRSEPRSGGLATFEAVARALGVLEGPEVAARLGALFDVMVERTLSSRGLGA